jgi:hypothetical protein
MSKNFIKISFIIVFQLFLVSCKNTPQKIQEYVIAYNNSASSLTTDLITATSAEAFLNEKKIEIKIETTLEQNKNNRMIYSQTMPAIFAEMIKKEKSSMELIDEGVKFKMFFLAQDYTVITELEVDKAMLDELLKKNKINPTENIGPSKSSLNSELQEVIALMNVNMPIKNEDGTKVLKIEINKENELVYQIETPDDFAKLLKKEGAAEIVKEGILRDGGLQNIFKAVKNYGISTIKYEYQDTNGKVINTILLTDKDLK